MKKISFLMLLASASLFAQQPQNFTELTGTVPAGPVTETIVTSHTENPVIATYTSQADFDQGLIDNCVDTTVTFEDFTGGPGAITTCGPVISSADGGACYGVGDLEDGFDVMASNASDVVFIPLGAIGNTTELVGANTFAEYTIINFSPGVYAAGMEIWANSDPNTDIRINGTGGLIEALTITTTVGAQEFWGVIADEEIVSIEIEGQADSGELFGVFTYGADCTQLGVDDNLLAQVGVYPNPTTDKLNIQVPAGIEIEAVVLYDVLGKATQMRVVDNSINISQMAEGMYLVNIETTQGTITKQVVKN